MFEEMNWFAMADDLEKSAAKLKEVKDLLAVLLPYHKQFSAVLDCAFEKVIAQIEVNDNVADCLYEVNREVTGA